MSKKSNAGEMLFAALCIVGIGAVLMVNNLGMLAQWAATLQTINLAGAGGMVQAAIGFTVVSALGGTVLWFRKPATTLDADGNPLEIDYSSPKWIRVKVIR